MKRNFLLLAAGVLSATLWAASGINYDGSTLELNNEFTRSQSGTMAAETMKETSGMAASRQTPGYLWAHGDENLKKNRKLVAVKPDGTLAMTLTITTPESNRDDWEDICTGVYGGKNYVFIGAIGDNNLEFNDQYYIYYFEEPEITSGTKEVTANTIIFGYPDNKGHNTETLMYDNIEQMFYVADKVEGGVCHLYKLPFKTNYSGVQKLTEVCALGNGSVFNLCTGGDITPDGQWMAIKNKQYILLWERQGSESLSETAKRRPVQIAAYQEEAQGESLAWTDASTFYTTSDQKKDMPIYKYARATDPSSAIVTGITVNGKALEGFKQDQLTYSYELPYGTSTMPTINASTTNEATIDVQLPISLPGDAKVICTSKDKSKSVTYTISLTVSATPSTDATLKSLSIDGSLVAGFQANVYEYKDTIAYTAALPVVTAEANDANAKINITNVTEVGKTPSTATVEVTAQDGSTKLTYKIAFVRADAIKKINEIIMSNGYNAYIPEDDQTRIQAFYLAGETAPTVKSYKVSEGCTWAQEGNKVTLTGADATKLEYTLMVEAIEPIAYTEDKMIFDGTEGTWIKSAYGWDTSKDNKKWKFSKTDTDYSREIAGKTHVELFLPACDTVVLFSMEKSEREIRVYANGAAVGDKVKLLKAGTAVAVNQSAPFMLTVASAQSSGDGGIAAIRMAKKSATGIERVQSDNVQCIKVIREGQLFILYNDIMYNVQGQVVK